MSFIDEFKIEADEDGWHAILYLDDGQRLDYRIGNPEALEYEVQRTLGEWLDESGRVAAAVATARRYFERRAVEAVTTRTYPFNSPGIIAMLGTNPPPERRFEEDGA